MLWVGFFPSRPGPIDRKTGEIVHYLPGADDENTLGAGTNVNSIYRDAAGYLWVAAGVAVWTGSTNALDASSTTGTTGVILTA